MSDQFPGNTASPTSPGSSTITINVYSKNVGKLWERAVGAGAKIVMPISSGVNVMARSWILLVTVGLYL
jgi:uncharacterized glyoxalase superfamily protein PhnB